jgi:hypothetical protein
MSMPLKVKFHNRLIISIILSILPLGCTLSTKIVPTITPIPQIIIETEVGDSTYRISEAELVNMLLENADSMEQFTILEPMITLDNGEAHLSATLQANPSSKSDPIIAALAGKFDCLFTISLNEIQQPVINFIKLTVNDIPVPGMILGQFSSIISTVIITNFQSSLGDLSIKDIHIDDGYITIITGTN